MDLRNSYNWILVVLLLVFTGTGCKEEYPLPPGLADKNYLVVEGFIDTGHDTTRIELSRTGSLDGGWEKSPGAGARVWIESEAGEISSLSEYEPGTYKGGPFTLNPNTRYRLQIETSDGRSYTSSFEEVKQTPEIDSINWARENDGVRIYVNTHDPRNESRFYAWEFEETWEFFSAYPSEFEYVEADSSIITRLDVEGIYRCWQHNVSTEILIGSSSKLSEDIIYYAPLTLIENNSWKLASRYTIKVKQRVLSRNAYEYLEKMKKSTESMGTIFDPMPTTDRGNIVCNTDPTEMVMEYVYVSSVKEQRIFISRAELGGWRYSMSCFLDTVANNKDSLEAAFGLGEFIPISAVATGNFITHYSGSTTYCMDCNLRGTNVKPDFWPY